MNAIAIPKTILDLCATRDKAIISFLEECGNWNASLLR